MPAVVLQHRPQAVFVVDQGAREQARVLLGQDAAPEIPLFDGGLVASPDGLGWSVPA